MSETTKPARIQRKRAKGWRLPEGCVCVDRTTGFGNPFPVVKCESTSGGITKTIWSVGTFEGPAMWFKDTKSEAVRLAVDAYRVWINHPKQETLRERAVVALRGRDLACWCSDGLCHARTTFDHWQVLSCEKGAALLMIDQLWAEIERLREQVKAMQSQRTRDMLTGRLKV